MLYALYFHVFSTHTFLLCHHKYHHDHGYFTFRAAGTPRCTRSLEAMLRWKLYYLGRSLNKQQTDDVFMGYYELVGSRI